MKMETRLERVKRFLLDMITSGGYKTYEITVIRRIILLYIITSIGIVVLIIFGIIAGSNNLLGLCAADLIVAFGLILVLVYARRENSHQIGIYISIGLFTILCYYLIISGGTDSTGFVWYYMFPLFVFFGLGSKKGIIATAILFIPSLIFLIIENQLDNTLNYSYSFKIRFTFSFLVVAAIAYIYEKTREITQINLKNKNDELDKAVSELKAAEKKLQMAGVDLEKRVEERTEKLSDANRKLIQEMEERMRVEETLRQSEEKYRLIAENTVDIISVLDMNMRYTYISPSITNSLGFTVQEAMEMPLDQVLTPASLQLVLSAFEDEMKLEAGGTADPKRIRRLELEKYRKDHSISSVEINLSFLRDKDQKAIGILAVSRDITERKKADEEKESLQAQLMQAQKMESVGRLAGGVAHDFNNMLSVILGNAELALLKLPKSDPVITDLNLIIDSANRSANLTRQLLAFARKQTIAPIVLDLNEIIDGMLKMLRRIIGEDIDLVWMPGAGLWQIKIDPSQVDQLLANLFVNARDAISGVGKVTIETENISFDKAYCAVHPGFTPGQYVMLAVSDDGHGMSKDILDHIFEPFFTTKEEGRGTGLGLATVYGIVKQSEGLINVYSEPDKGSTFKIYLPISKVEFTQAITERIIDPVKGHGELVLLVEDEPNMLNVIRDMLDKLGYTVLFSDKPAEALRQAKKYNAQIQLLITDVVMPEMNGRELAKLVAEFNPGIKCLYASGYTANAIAHHGVLEKGINFIQKPFSMQSLAAKVQEVLKQK
jgi:PAS domain S-box-containing protein